METNMEQNPLLTESPLPWGAPQFDRIRTGDYLPAFRRGIAEAKAEIDAVTANPEPPTFENTVEALEYAGRTLSRVTGIFYNLLEADTDDEMQRVAEEAAPLMTEYEMYVSLNAELFARVKAVYDRRDTLDLPPDARKLLENTYRSFARNGAALAPEDKARYSAWAEELSLLTLRFGKHVLAATHAFELRLTREEELAGLPDHVRDIGASAAREKGLPGWVFTLDAPSYVPFMKYSACRDLRERMYRAYNGRALSGENDNREIVRQIVDLRIRMSALLGYGTYAGYALEERMARHPETVGTFLQRLLEPSLPCARRELDGVLCYAREHGFEGECLMPWDLSFWAEKYREAEFSLSEEQLKPYFRLEDCIAAVFGLARRLYGLEFRERSDLPVYHPDVKVYEVTEADGRHLALFYADFFPRPSKRGGAWMTEFRGQSICGGVEERPHISIVTNFTKPTATAPSLLTHDELVTFLHEFGHALHGILAEGRYPSLTGTSVARDFVELPSQLMENWAYESAFLDSFARHYRTGEVIPKELVDRIVAAQHFLAGYYQVRQLHFGLLDMAWHSLASLPDEDLPEFESRVLGPVSVLPAVAGCAVSPAFSHIFAGGYAAGYYSYKWAEVLEADAFALFRERGIFDRETAASFRRCILSRGGTEDADVLYRNFRGRDPQPEALLEKLGIRP